MLRGEGSGGRAASLPDRWHPWRRVLVDRRRRPLHERARHERAFGPDHDGADREHDFLPCSKSVRRARGRQEPQPMLSRLTRGHVFRGARAPCLHGADRTKRRAHRSARRRHGRGARAVHALRRIAGRRAGRGAGVSFGFPYIVRSRARRCADRAARPVPRRQRPASRRSSPRPAVAASWRRARCGSTSTGCSAPLRMPRHAPGQLHGTPGAQRLVDRFLWLRSGQAGWWEPAVQPGDLVAQGAGSASCETSTATCSRKSSHPTTASSCSSPRAPRWISTGFSSASGRGFSRSSSPKTHPSLVAHATWRGTRLNIPASPL